MLSFFPRDVLDEILNLIESISEGFPTYSCYLKGYSHNKIIILFSRRVAIRFHNRFPFQNV